ncbi:MAG: YqgE/AlgH family protein [Ilumatobacteraceae bacterium]
MSTPGFSSGHESCKGSLLVATPPLTDPNFDRTVVYVLEHTADGAVGVVLNRQLPEEAPGELRTWAGHMSPPATLFSGGPVDDEALIALARLSGPLDGSWSQVAEGLGSIDLMLEPYEVAQSVLALRVFRGYSGWGAGQLDDELAEGAWMVLPAELGDVFCPDPAALWRTVLRRQGGSLAWVANAPDDLSSN